MAMAAAFDTLRLASALVVEMRQMRSHRLAREMPQAFAFGAEHERQRSGEGGGFERLVAILRQADAQHAALAELGRALALRFLTSTMGTRSSAPLAALASTPESGGLCRSVRTRPDAPKAAAERSAAPTLCGSVTWSSTSRMPFVIDIVEADGRERPGFERHALMHGVGAEQPVEILRGGGLRCELAFGDERAPAGGRHCRWRAGARRAGPDWRVRLRRRAGRR